jgi:hypothetical protein
MNIIKVEQYIGTMPNNHMAVQELMDRHWSEFMDSLLITKKFKQFLEFLKDAIKEKLDEGSTNASLPVIETAILSFYQIAKYFEEHSEELTPEEKKQFKGFLDDEYKKFRAVVSGRLSEVLPYEI